MKQSMRLVLGGAPGPQCPHHLTPLLTPCRVAWCSWEPLRCPPPSAATLPTGRSTPTSSCQMSWLSLRVQGFLLSDSLAQNQAHVAVPHGFLGRTGPHGWLELTACELQNRDDGASCYPLKALGDTGSCGRSVGWGRPPLRAALGR